MYGASHLKVGHHFNRVQRMFTKRIQCLHHLTYDERLSSSKLEVFRASVDCNLDLVLLYKIVHGFVDIIMYDIGVSPVTERQSLRNYGVGLNVCKPSVESAYVLFC